MNPCEAPACTWPRVCKGLCRAHYNRLLTTGSVGGPVRRKSFTANRLVDALMLDGGWLTLSGIMLMFPGSTEDGISKALGRLKKRGLVESRMVFLGMYDRRKEWRIA